MAPHAGNRTNHTCESLDLSAAPWLYDILQVTGRDHTNSSQEVYNYFPTWRELDPHHTSRGERGGEECKARGGESLKNRGLDKISLFLAVNILRITYHRVRQLHSRSLSVLCYQCY